MIENILMHSKSLPEFFSYSKLFSLFFSSTFESILSHSLLTNSCYSISLCNIMVHIDLFLAYVFFIAGPFLPIPKDRTFLISITKFVCLLFGFPILDIAGCLLHNFSPCDLHCSSFVSACFGYEI